MSEIDFLDSVGVAGSIGGAMPRTLSPRCCFRAIKQKLHQIKSFDVLISILSTTITYHFTKT